MSDGALATANLDLHNVPRVTVREGHWTPSQAFSFKKVTFRWVVELSGSVLAQHA